MSEFEFPQSAFRVQQSIDDDGQQNYWTVRRGNYVPLSALREDMFVDENGGLYNASGPIDAGFCKQLELIDEVVRRVAQNK